MAAAQSVQQTRTYTGLRLCRRGLCLRYQLATRNLPRGISVLDGTVGACWLCRFILHRSDIFKHVIRFFLLSSTPSNKTIQKLLRMDAGGIIALLP